MIFARALQKQWQCFGILFLFASTRFVIAQEAPSPQPTPATALAAPAGDHRGGVFAQEGTEVGLRLDCLHDFNIDKGSSQDCLTISGLRLAHTHVVSKQVRGYFRLDPYGTPSDVYSDTPARREVPLNVLTASSLGLVDDYAVVWSPRPNLDISIEDYAGAVRLPSTSGLSPIQSLSDAGWKQTAAAVTYHLSALSGMHVKFAAGNGEGENGTNQDAQQYFAFEARTAIIPGVAFDVGVSFDGNSVGSDRYKWNVETFQQHCGPGQAKEKPSSGYSSQRMGGGLILDGTLPQARGFKAGLGWQRTVMTDLNKRAASYPTESDLAGCDRLDPSEVFVEDPLGEVTNTVQHTTVAINTSYRLLDTYFVGLDYRQRKLDTGSANLFQVCSDFAGVTCQTEGSPRNTLSQTAFTVGGGMDLAEGLVFSMDYSRVSFDKKYSKFYYLGRSGQAEDTREVINARVAYNWR